MMTCYWVVAAILPVFARQQGQLRKGLGDDHLGPPAGAALQAAARFADLAFGRFDVRLSTSARPPVSCRRSAACSRRVETVAIRARAKPASEPYRATPCLLNGVRSVEPTSHSPSRVDLLGLVVQRSIMASAHLSGVSATLGTGQGRRSAS